MYDLTYRRLPWPFKRTLKAVKGHKYYPLVDKLWVTFEDGSAREVPHWSACEIRLGPDWIAEGEEAERKVSKKEKSQLCIQHSPPRPHLRS